MKLQVKAGTILVFVLLLAVFFLSGCIGNQSNMEIGPVDKAEDLKPSMPTEPVVTPTTTNSEPLTAMDNATAIQKVLVEDWIRTMLPIMLLIPILFIIMKALFRRDDW